MFVQIDELPSMYSRPRLSRSSAPCPSTKTSGSWSGAHHSGMFVNGCQTNRLSASINASLISGLLLDKFVNRHNILERRTAALIFSCDDLLQVQKILKRRRIVISPFSFAGNFRLEPPHATEFRGAHFPLFPMSISLRPYMLTPHRGKTLH